MVTPREFAVLEFLMRHAGQTMTRTDAAVTPVVGPLFGTDGAFPHARRP